MPPRIQKSLTALGATGLLGQDVPLYVMADEPKIPAFVSYPSDGAKTRYCDQGVSGFGIHRRPAIARIKARAECLEGFCLINLPERTAERSAFRDPRAQIDPAMFLCYSAAQVSSLPELRDRCRAEDYLWWPALDHAAKRPVQVPAQLVFNAPDLQDEHGIRRERISTGAALGPLGSDAAFETGLLECVERDACTAAYLQKRALPRIVELPERLSRFVAYIERYRLEPFLFDATSDLGIPTVLAVTIDRTGYGPAVTSGSSAQFGYAQAIEKALLESLQSRATTRVGLSVECPKGLPDGSQITSATQRMYFWYPKERIAALDFLLASGETVTYRLLRAGVRSAADAIAHFAARGWNVLEADLTLPEIRRHGFEVKKVLIPQLQPLYQDESAKALFSEHHGPIADDPELPPHPMA